MLKVKVNPQPVNQSGTEISNLSKADLSQTSPKGIKKKSKEIKKEIQRDQKREREKEPPWGGPQLTHAPHVQSVNP